MSNSAKQTEILGCVRLFCYFAFHRLEQVGLASRDAGLTSCSHGCMYGTKMRSHCRWDATRQRCNQISRWRKVACLSII